MLERLPVRLGLHQTDQRMTRTQALRYGIRHMPSDLKRAGFECFVSRSDREMHGGVWFRVSYGYRANPKGIR
jgi:hypothetical protein